ncbi:hypothetical protein [Salinigranum marinum]|nr:hypothetical protein [Salinigranum marinum]
MSTGVDASVGSPVTPPATTARTILSPGAASSYPPSDRRTK